MKTRVWMVCVVLSCVSLGCADDDAALAELVGSFEDAETTETSVDGTIDASVLGDGGSDPEPDVSDPEPDVSDVEPDVSAPAPDVSAPAPDVSDPAPDVSDPAPDVSDPEPDVSDPEPDVSDPDPLSGSTNGDCGGNQPETEAVDCTQYGDSDSMCVFSDHCMCSDGFVCEQVAEGLPAESNECASGSSCIPEIVGAWADSCGSPEQGVEPVDCTAQGDQSAMCVFSNHCMCGVGYKCEEPYPGLSLSDKECAAGSICIPMDDSDFGASSTNCGTIESGPGPVDCTANGDTDAYCVFGDHCACSNDFICDGEGSGFEVSKDCLAGNACVLDPLAGSWPWSCGQEGQGLIPVDCGKYGDPNPGCVFSNHCACSPGYECETLSDDGGCASGAACVPEEM